MNNTALTVQPAHTLSAHSADPVPKEKLQMLTDAIMKGADRQEAEFFAEVCNRVRLDPFRKQIHAVQRWDSKAKRMIWSFQTGVDGFRAIAHRTGLCAGIDDATFNPRDESTEFPHSATVTVYRIVGGQRVPFTATARWKEYVQTTKEGNITSMWLKLPYSQLAKCAECLALRKAFPEEIGDLRSDEEMAQATNIEPAPRPLNKLERIQEDAPAPSSQAALEVAAEVVPEPKKESKPKPPSRLPSLMVPDEISEYAGGRWKFAETVQGDPLGNLKWPMVLDLRQSMPKHLVPALLASFIDEILATLDKAGVAEAQFAAMAGERPEFGLDFDQDLWMNPANYPALLDLAKSFASA